MSRLQLLICRPKKRYTSVKKGKAEDQKSRIKLRIETKWPGLSSSSSQVPDTGTQQTTEPYRRE